MRVIEMTHGARIPDSGLNFIGLAYDPNWMPAFLVFEPNRDVFKTDEVGVGFLLDVRGIISNTWFADLLACDTKEVVGKVLKVCSACFEDNPERLERLDDLQHWSIAFNVEFLRTHISEPVTSQYTMYFPRYKPTGKVFDLAGQFSF
ncbi:hypothetical protein [Thiomicrorhabdus aquaedulcis]|uniref:hypothetical protein n=1 Tax=Thiomicrorhabdus aquaedulcis TaxID=2211106 RepID=UPI000FDB549B|nr:hypothetical protein [Thiomicrorhabdus aquaedulcis]